MKIWFGLKSKKTIGFIGWLIVMLLAGCAPVDGGGGQGAPGGAEEAVTAMPFSEASTVFQILPAESEARFLIDEILNGKEKTVVGQTNQVSGQMAVDFADPSTAAVGPIQVNANTLTTDNGFRDRAVQRRILLAGIFEFITFTPTAVNGLPEEIVLGETIDFEIDGELTVTSIAKPVTFKVTAVPISDSRIEGSGSTTIKYGDFDLVIPSATGVAAVAEEVFLELDFVAEAEE